MQDINKSLDEKLFSYLKSKNLGLYQYYQKFFFLPINHDKRKLKNTISFFDELKYHQYSGDIKFDKKSVGRDIFIHLYQNASSDEKLILLKNAFHFINFVQVINFLMKEDKKEAISYFSKYPSNGKLRQPEEEEELINKIKNLDKDNFYNNLLSYLSNNSGMYAKSIYCHKYQSILKEVVNENFPEKRANFSIFIGDNLKKELNSDSLFFEDSEFETIIKLNKTYFDEKFSLKMIDVKSEKVTEKERILNKIENLLKESKRFNFLEVVKFYPNNKEVSHLYLKHKIDYDKKDIESYLQSCLEYWNDNILDLKKMSDEEMIKEVANKGEKILLYKKMSEKLDEKNQKSKKVKI